MLGWRPDAGCTKSQKLLGLGDQLWIDVDTSDGSSLEIESWNIINISDEEL